MRGRISFLGCTRITFLGSEAEELPLFSFRFWAKPLFPLDGTAKAFEGPVPSPDTLGKQEAGESEEARLTPAPGFPSPLPGFQIGAGTMHVSFPQVQLCLWTLLGPGDWDPFLALDHLLLSF